MIPALFSRWRRNRRLRRKKPLIMGQMGGVAPHGQLAQRSGVKAFFYIALIIATHTLAMMQFEGFGFGDSVWLTLTSITTVGYGDLSATTVWGRLSTVLVLYIGGIFVVGNMAGDFFDYRSNRREAMKNGNWSWTQMKDHIVIIGSKADSEQHLARLMSECKSAEATAGREIVLISECFDHGLPTLLQGFDIKYVKGCGSSPGALQQASVKNAEIVIVLALNEEDSSSDGNAFDVVCRIREINCSAKVVAECVDDDNRQRLEKAGATLVLRPVRAYPEMIIGGLLHPGSTVILENLFTAQGERIVRLDEALTGLWADIVSKYVQMNAGTPIAYRDTDTGKIITAPPGNTTISADALFLLGG
ncbi:MAG: NAD-binding protein [Magnetovibrio sp.]|nr:NAD-binding protein [Magnetovibrio sp.]